MKARTMYTQLRPEERVVISCMRLLGRPRPSAANCGATAARGWATPATRRACCTLAVARRPSQLPISTSTASPGAWCSRCWTGNGRPSRSPPHSSECSPTSPNATGPTRPSTRPHLRCVASTNQRAILTTIQTSVPRVSEAVQLQPPDIDSARMVLRVDQARTAT